MKRFLLALVLALAAVPAAAQQLSDRDRADVARIEAYLNTITSLRGRFLQVAPDGAVSEGKVWLRRPGRLRFEYDPPVPVLVVADGLFVVMHDKELGQVNRIPLGTTPLSVLLRDEIKLAGGVAVKGVERQPGTLRVTVFDTDRPREGELTLVFSDMPLALRQWVVTDARGLSTSVSLANVEFNLPLEGRLFVFTDPAPDERPRR